MAAYFPQGNFVDGPSSSTEPSDSEDADSADSESIASSVITSEDEEIFDEGVSKRGVWGLTRLKTEAVDNDFRRSVFMCRTGNIAAYHS